MGNWVVVFAAELAGPPHADVDTMVKLLLIYYFIWDQFSLEKVQIAVQFNFNLTDWFKRNKLKSFLNSEERKPVTILNSIIESIANFF